MSEQEMVHCHQEVLEGRAWRILVKRTQTPKCTLSSPQAVLLKFRASGMSLGTWAPFLFGDEFPRLVLFWSEGGCCCTCHHLNT